MELSQQDLMNLVNLAKSQTVEAPKIPTDQIYQKYLETHKLSSYSKTDYDYIMKRFIEAYPILPTEAIKINEYISKLKTAKGKELSFITRNNHFVSIKTIINFAVKFYKIPDYTKDIEKPINHSPEEEHNIKTPEELSILIDSCKKTMHRLIILVLIDSGCRIGELGYTPDHPGLTVEHVHPDKEFIEVHGKTGYHKMHCNQELCYALIQNAAPNGSIFHSQQQPDGMTAKTMTALVKNLFDAAYPKSKKMGAHTIRHSVGTFLADLSGNSKFVQNFLRHAKAEMSEKYIHLSEERKNALPSPLKLMHLNADDQQQKPIQRTMLTEGTQSPDQTEASTALIIPGEILPIEHVEATIDITEERFITPDGNKHRPQLSPKEIEAMRTAFIFYTRNAQPNDQIPGILSRMFNRMFQRPKTEADPNYVHNLNYNGTM